MSILPIVSCLEFAGKNRNCKPVVCKITIEEWIRVWQVSGLTDKLTWVKYNDLKKENKEKEGVFKIESQKLEGMLEREAARVQPRK